ncbi:fasciclin domain-containing protein [Zafaria sp. J156]|uniref:fasciclin domain-containing protein n=1 Tax=Zafaria sp. J156 TaxID=3116490 RepID=UPI002E7AA46E|nr:fasciclin domain-containing protein [Zafaria sp. J156]MEE1619805.1 fasciclin domain-containing protein [Zafaria sp. J156]
MKTLNRRFAGALGIVAIAGLGLTACAGGADPGQDPSSPEGGNATSAPASAPATSEAAMDPAAGLVGPGCAAYAEQVPDGAGSVEGMALDPVAVAASNNPLLTTLTSAVSGELNPDVDLVDTLNGDEFTVFAPVDEAFAAIPEADLTGVVEDSEMLSSVLTYHVVPGQLTPDEVMGLQATVQGADVEVTGSGDSLMVNDANVICGGVKTANATVYLIDAVLMPPAETK